MVGSKLSILLVLNYWKQWGELCLGEVMTFGTTWTQGIWLQLMWFWHLRQSPQFGNMVSCGVQILNGLKTRTKFDWMKETYFICCSCTGVVILIFLIFGQKNHLEKKTFRKFKWINKTLIWTKVYLMKYAHNIFQIIDMYPCTFETFSSKISSENCKTVKSH